VSVASGITSIEDIDEGVSAAAMETTQRDKVRSQVRWTADLYQAEKVARDVPGVRSEDCGA